MKRILILTSLIIFSIFLIKPIYAISIGTGVNNIPANCNFMDINLDNQINNQDLSIIETWNNTYCLENQDIICYRSDLNNDGNVNQLDILFWNDKLNNECDTQLAVWTCTPIRLRHEDNYPLFRSSNYAYNDEYLGLRVLVFDKTNINNIEDVYFTHGDTLGIGNEKNNISCTKVDQNILEPECNARILSGKLDSFDPDHMAYYFCKVKFNSTYGPKFITVEAKDSLNLTVISDWNENWFLNPIIKLSLDSNSGNHIPELNFGETLSTQTYYSDSILLGNDVEQSSGVKINISIFGKDLIYELENNFVCRENSPKISYFATNGAYSTISDPRADNEGYIEINEEELLAMMSQEHPANKLSPGQEMTLTFRLDIPNDCEYGSIEGTNLTLTGTDITNKYHKDSVNVPIRFKINNSIYDKPFVFKCGNTSYRDELTEPGRVSQGGQELIERKGKYLFEGEQIIWKVLLTDLKGINNIDSVDVTIGNKERVGNDIEVHCKPILTDTAIPSTCDLREYKELIKEFNPITMRYYNCIFTVETPSSMQGQYFITVQSRDRNGKYEIMPESELWFLNPIVSFSINDSIIFNRMIPGQTIYSNEVTLTNTADLGSEVVLDMFISGTNFLSGDENAYCPDKKTLPLNQFRYYASKGDIDTKDLSNSDINGYRPINYGIGFNNPDPFYNRFEILPKDNDPELPPYYLSNQIGPDENMKLKLKINVPEQCSGEFDSGNIYVWAEAI